MLAFGQAAFASVPKQLPSFDVGLAILGHKGGGSERRAAHESVEYVAFDREISLRWVELVVQLVDFVVSTRVAEYSMVNVHVAYVRDGSF